jgi:hypothetical protein
VNRFLSICAAGLAAAVFSPLAGSAQTRTLRIVTYNISADFTNSLYPTWPSVGPPLPGLIAPPGNPVAVTNGGVLEGIGEEIVGNDPAQPVDILALQETTTNSITVAPIVSGLNAFYGIAGMYTNSSYQATESFGDPTFGNGPNAVVFNTKTVRLLASAPVDPPGGTSKLGGISSSKSGMYREVMRYQFAPAGVPTNAFNVFYLCVSHYKSGSGGSSSTQINNTNSRAGEAFIVRSNMMSLPAGSRIVYVGDFNTGDASEPMYSILTAPGTNQLIDLLNPSRSLTTNWDSGTFPVNLTESAMYLQYRDDYQMMTTNIYYGNGSGLKLVSGTYHAFGNNGTTLFSGSVNSGSNTALNNHLATNGPVFISAAQLYQDLTNASDHLPVVADYTIPVPAPRITGVSVAGTNLVLTVTNGITNATYTVLMNTNLAAALTNWTALATNVAGAGSFIFTATNAVDKATAARFYMLQEK